uniref:Ataxin-10 n=1 Tax=Strongyloides venezuelensis TaxID=75913 RepID=A0A0K0FJF3_STRVS
MQSDEVSTKASDNEVLSYLREISSTNTQTKDIEFYLKKLTRINEKYRSDVGKCVYDLLMMRLNADESQEGFQLIALALKVMNNTLLNNNFVVNSDDQTANALSTFYTLNDTFFSELFQFSENNNIELVRETLTMLSNLMTFNKSEVRAAIFRMNKGYMLIRKNSDQDNIVHDLACQIISNITHNDSVFVEYLFNCGLFGFCLELIIELDCDNPIVGNAFYLLGCSLKNSAYCSRLFINELTFKNQLAFAITKIISPYFPENVETFVSQWNSDRTRNCYQAFYVLESILIHNNRMSIKNDAQMAFIQTELFFSVANFAFLNCADSPEDNLINRSRFLIAKMMDSNFTAQSYFSNIRNIDTNDGESSFINSTIHNIEKFDTVTENTFALLDVIVAFQHGNELCFDTWFGTPDANFNNVAVHEEKIRKVLIEYLLGNDTFEIWIATVILNNILVGCPGRSRNLWDYEVVKGKRKLHLWEAVIIQIMKHSVTHGPAKTGLLSFLFIGLNVNIDCMPKFLKKEPFLKFLRDEFTHSVGDENYNRVNKGIIAMLLTNIFANHLKFPGNGDNNNVWAMVHDQYGLQDLYNAIYSFTCMPEYTFAATEGESYTMYHNNTVMLDYTLCRILREKELSFYKILNNEEPCLLDTTTRNSPHLEPYIEALTRQDVKICELIAKLDKYETLFDDLVDKVASISNQCDVTLITNLVKDVKGQTDEDFEPINNTKIDELVIEKASSSQPSINVASEIERPLIIEKSGSVNKNE